MEKKGELSTEQYHGGQKSLKLTTTNVATVDSENNNTSVEKEKTYKLTGYVYSTKEVYLSKPRVKLSLPGTGGIAWTIELDKLEGWKANDWTYFEKEFTVPDDSVYQANGGTYANNPKAWISLRLIQNTSNASGTEENIYFDDISIVEIAASSNE